METKAFVVARALKNFSAKSIGTVKVGDKIAVPLNLINEFETRGLIEKVDLPKVASSDTIEADKDSHDEQEPKNSKTSKKSLTKNKNE